MNNFNFFGGWLLTPWVLVFAMIKFAGYSLLLKVLMKLAPTYEAIAAGLLRGILGLLVGIAVLESFKLNHESLITFYAFVLLLRIGEWALVLKIFYPREFSANRLKLSLITTGASTLLDVFAVTGVISKMGIIC